MPRDHVLHWTVQLHISFHTLCVTWASAAAAWSAASRVGWLCASISFFFFKNPATTEISPLPLHAALPICERERRLPPDGWRRRDEALACDAAPGHRDRKSTRLNSSHVSESRMPSSA